MENTERQDNAELGNNPRDIEREQREQIMLEREKMIRKAQKIDLLITIGIVLLVAAVIAVGVWFAFFRDRDNGYSEYDAKLDKLAHKKQQLLTELDKLGPDMEKQLGNTSYMSLIFTSLDSAIYTSAHPIMAEGSNDLVGIMAMSPNEIPGLEGKITKNQYDALIKLEWGTALYWNGEGDLREYILNMQTLLDSNEINFPETIIFKAKTYSVTYDALLLEYGIKNAIHNGEGGLPIRIDVQPEGVWHPGVVGWKAGMSATLLKRSVESEGGYALLEINFNNSSDNSAYSYFELEGEEENSRIESFRKMVNLFKTSMRTGNIEVLSAEAVRAKVEKYYSERTVIEIEHAQRRNEINAEINDIERQMTELYHEYHQGGK